ncbi:MAG: hypothetical protein ACKVS6_12900 [Planctomycetota bacterium]
MKRFTILVTTILLFGVAIAFARGATTVSVKTTAPTVRVAAGEDVPLKYSRIYWEYNSSANDLGVHVTLDGEDWTRLRITNPNNKLLFDVVGKGPYKNLGMTELFFEGAEPSLDDFPLADLLALFPEGEYEFDGKIAGGGKTEGTWMFSHAIPDGPLVSAEVGPNDFLKISWTAVTTNPPGFPNKPLNIVKYQVIVEDFLVTVPANVLSLTVSPEFVATLAAGEHLYEVLAIDANANQTLREGSFIK